MSEYIKRDKVYRALNTLLNSVKVGKAWNNILRCLPILKNTLDTSADYDEGLCNGLSLAINTIENIPAADIRLERHGHWIEEGDIQICSECGEDHSWQDYRASYCDCCGAKMDGKDGEQNE